MDRKELHATIRYSRFAKHKGCPSGVLEAHHERKKERYASNPDIDTERSKYNFHITIEWESQGLSNTATYELTADISGSEENRSWLLDRIFNLVMATGKGD